jgi:hypothetical protein
LSDQIWHRKFTIQLFRFFDQSEFIHLKKWSIIR